MTPAPGYCCSRNVSSLLAFLDGSAAAGSDRRRSPSCYAAGECATSDSRQRCRGGWPTPSVFFLPPRDARSLRFVPGRVRCCRHNVLAFFNPGAYAFVVPPFAECAKDGASTARVASATSTAEPHARISSERTVVGGFGGELSGPPLKKQVPFDFAQGRLSALSPRCARLLALGMTESKQQLTGG